MFVFMFRLSSLYLMSVSYYTRDLRYCDKKNNFFFYPRLTSALLVCRISTPNITNLAYIRQSRTAPDRRWIHPSSTDECPSRLSNFNAQHHKPCPYIRQSRTAPDRRWIHPSSTDERLSRLSNP